MKRTWFILILLLNGLFVSAQIFDVDTIQYTGNSDNRINLVILSDGYQAHELPRFAEDAKKFSKSFFAESPYAEYQNYFNVFIIKVPSKESGAGHPGTATDITEPEHPVVKVDNYFGSTFDYFNIHRLLVPTNTAAITNVLAKNFPMYDEVLVLVNSPHYGGSGGQYATASLHSSSTEVAIHEIGHSFVGLNDEYYAGDSYASEAINMTQETDPSKVKWKNWIKHKEVGIFQYCCGGNSSSWYRPHENCKMRYLGKPFCSVCVEGTIEEIHSLVSVVDGSKPAGNTIIEDLSPVKFELNLIKSKPNTLKVKWLLNGTAYGNNKESVLISADKLKSGKNILTAVVQDTTLLVRKENHEKIHAETVSWTIENKVSGNAGLSALAISDVSLSPAFKSDILTYKGSVGHAVPSIKVTATTEDKGATLAINGTTVASGAASSAILLKEGSNAILVKVTAQDGTTTKLYTIDVNREKPTAKIAPAITFSNETKTFGTADFGLTAKSNSSGAITYQVMEKLTAAYPGDVKLSGLGNGTVSILKSGKVRLRVNVAEDTKYLAGSAEMDLTINKATAVVTLAGLDQDYNGKPRPVVVTTKPEGLSTKVFYNGSAEVPAAARAHEVHAVIQDANYVGEARAILTINKATAVVSVKGLDQEYNGTPRPVVVNTRPEGLPTKVFYNGSADVPVAAGEYEVRALIQGDNYSGEARERLLIRKATAIVTITELDQDYDGKPKPVVVTTRPEGLPAKVFYNGSANVPAAAGEYLVRAEIQDKNYSGEASAKLFINSPTAALSALAISEGTLSPAFKSNIVSYNASVGHAVSSVQVTATTEDRRATLTINGTVVSSGTSSAISLNAGSNNPISIKVTAQDGSTTNYYTIDISRAGAPAKSPPAITFSNEVTTFGTAAFSLPATSNSSGAITYQIVEELTAAYPGDVRLSGPGNRLVSVVKSGKVRLRAEVAEDDQYLSGSAEMDLTINKANAVVTITELDQEFNGEPRPVVVTTIPEGLDTKVYYNGTSDVPETAGEHEVLAIIQDDNYIGEASASLIINFPTAVPHNELTKEIRLYPNPTSSKALLELKAGMIAEVMILDIAGRMIRREETIGSYEVDLENNVAGTYLIIVRPKGEMPVYLKLQKF